MSITFTVFSHTLNLSVARIINYVSKIQFNKLDFDELKINFELLLLLKLLSILDLLSICYLNKNIFCCIFALTKLSIDGKNSLKDYYINH